MSDLTVLVTGCGAPGTIGTLWSLQRQSDDRTLRTVGTDIRKEQPGRFACNSFYTVPPANGDGFVDEMVSICESEAVDVVLPQVTVELPVLAASSSRFEDVGTTVALSSEPVIASANNTESVIEACNRLGIPTPETISVTTWSDLTDAADQLGFPDSPFVVKPPVSNGQRGFRLVEDGENRKKAFYDEKPEGGKTTMDRLHSVLGDSFPRLLVMEYLPGEEFTVDAFRYGSKSVAVPRSRDRIRSGISFRTSVVKEVDLIDRVETLADAIGLEYAFGFQFKRANDGTLKILECNPRVQGTMVTATLAGSNVIDAAVKAAVGEPIPPFDTDWNTKFYRYWGGIGVSNDHQIGNIGESL